MLEKRPDVFAQRTLRSILSPVGYIPDIYDDCLERVHLPSVGSIPEKVSQKESEEVCYCDVRKRQQVEQRLRKHKELLELTDGRKN